MSLELYLIRHADAGDPAAWEGDDADRPLSDKGHRQCERLRRHLDALGFAPNLVLTSPKLRATQTAELVGAGLSVRPVVDERLASGFDVAALDALSGEHPEARRLVIVGHDPDFSSLASDLTGASISMKKGALVRIDLDLPIRPGAGRLRWLIPPESLPK